MNIPDLTRFNQDQQQALFELLVLTMYADGHITAIEDEYLKRLLEAMKCEDVDRALDEGVTKTRTYLKSLSDAKKRMLELASVFTTRSQHLQVYRVVEAMVMNDGKISSWESELLSELRLKFRV